MSRHSAPITREIPWTEVLRLLEIPVRSSVLPRSVECPLCRRGYLWIYPDDALGSEWLDCRYCGFAGDIIELASRVWKLSIKGTLFRLGLMDMYLLPETLTEERVQRYEEQHIDYRARINDFWQSCRRRLARGASPEMVALVRTVAGITVYEQSDWLHCGGRFLGACNRLDVERLFHPGSTDYREWTHHKGHGAGRQRIFVGGGWNDVLVVPFFDLPGRITGFVFIGREGIAANGDFVYKATQLAGRTGRFREIGIQMMDSMFAPPHRDLGDTTFVIPSLSMAMMLQLSWLRDHSIPLPLVGTFTTDSAASRSIRSYVPMGDLVFFTHEISDEVLAQAKSANARVSLLTLSKAKLQWVLCHYDALPWLQSAKRQAVPWQEALRRRLLAISTEAAAELLTKLEFTWSEMRDLIAGSLPALRARLEPLLVERLGPPRARVCGRDVVERDDGWYLMPQNELISDAIVRIEQVLRTTRGPMYYRGHVRFRGEQIAFVEPTEHLDRGLLAWASKFLLRSGKGQMAFRPTWSQNALSVATTLRPPEFFAAADSVGYHADILRFCFPRFSVALNGNVSEAPFQIIANSEVPAANLQPPSPLTPAEVAALSATSSDMAVLWAMAACIIDGLVSKFANRQPARIALVEPGAQVTGRLAARLLGCIEFAVPPQRMKVIWRRPRRACEPHDWPAVLTTPSGRLGPKLKTRLANDELVNFVAPFDWHTAWVCAMRGGWHVVHCDDQPGTSPLPGAASRIIPAYFQDLARRHFIYKITRPCWIRGLLEDMAEWFERSGGAGRAVSRANHVLIPSDGYPARHLFLDMIEKLVADGDLDLVTDDSPSALEGRPAVVHRSDRSTSSGSVWIPQYAISRLLDEKRALPLDILVVT